MSATLEAFIPVNMTDMTETISDTSIDLMTERTETTEKCHIHQAMYIVIGLVGTLDNAFVLFIIWSYKPLRQYHTNLYIANQSMIDAIGSVLVIIAVSEDGCMDQVVSGLSGLSGVLYCKLWKSQVWMWGCFMCSTTNLVIITLERYAEVVYPIWHKSFMTQTKAYSLIVLVWIIGMGRGLALGITTSGVTNGVCNTWIIFPSKAIATFNGVFDFVIAFFIPVMLMIFCYVHMALTLKRKVNPTSTSITPAEKTREIKMARFRRNIILTMATVCLCFVLCWCWNVTWFFLQTIGCPLPWSTAYYHFSLFAVFFNSLINPIIYIARYEHFKKAVRTVVFKKATLATDANTTMTETGNN